MDVAGFIFDIIMELLMLYLAITFLRTYSLTQNKNFEILGIAFSTFFLIDVIDNFGTNLFKIRFFEYYHVHDVMVILGLLTLIYVIKSPSEWKMKLEKEKKVA